MVGKKNFKEKEFRYLYRDMSNIELAKYFNVSTSTIINYSNILGLSKRPPKIIRGGLPEKEDK